MDLPPVERFGAAAREPASRDEEARLAVRLVCRRVPDPAERAEVLAALGLSGVDSAGV